MMSLPLAAWPAADRMIWAEATRECGLFESTGPAFELRATSRRRRVYGYGRWLAWLQTATPNLLDTPPAERITPAHLAAYQAHLQPSCGAYARASYLAHLLAFARYAAPQADWTWLRNLKRLHEQRCQPRHAPSMHPNAVMDLGEALIAQGRTMPDHREAARLIRDGTLLVTATLLPLRRQNLANLEIGRHLTTHGDGYRLTLTGAETKAGRPLNYRLPDRLTRILQTYIADTRPGFPGADSPRLWLSCHSGPLGNQGVYRVITRRTEIGLGVRLRPHDLRDIAASFIAETAPAQALIARDLLGHADYRTTERHYMTAQGLAAGARYAETLQTIRRPRTGRP